MHPGDAIKCTVPRSAAVSIKYIRCCHCRNFFFHSTKEERFHSDVYDTGNRLLHPRLLGPSNPTYYRSFLPTSFSESDGKCLICLSYVTNGSSLLQFSATIIRCIIIVINRAKAFCSIRLDDNHLNKYTIQFW